MARPIIHIYDAETGEDTVREMNDAEYADWLAQADARTSQQASEVRSQRNARLAECDWTQLADSGTDKDSWATYRQALRDITKQPEFPRTIKWPTAPSA